jgi:predicted nuclease of predicted toxin-antitoxin system
MSLRFFLDHCVPSSVERALSAAGHEVLILKHHLPADAPDPQVIAEAQARQAILVSLNGDFADLVTYPPSVYGGIIGLQLHNQPSVMPHLMERLVRYLAEHPNPEVYRGKLLIVEPHRIRIRE